MKTVKFGKYIFCIGQRVAVNMGNKGNWYYGVITKLIDHETVAVRFDVGHPNHKRRDVLLSNVVPVINWNIDESAHPFEELTITNLMPHKTVGTKPLSLDAHIFDALWSYTNEILFDGKLRRPAFKFNAKLRILGLCHPTGMHGTKPTLIEISKRNVSAYNMYETLVHEMVHQYNFEHNKINDGHGKLFLMWKGPIKSILDMELSQFADLEEMDTRVDLSKSPKQRKGKKKYYAALHYPVDNDARPLYAVVAFKDKDAALEYYVRWQNYTERQNLMTNVYRKFIEGSKIFEKVYGQKPSTKYNRHDTTLTFYETDNTNADLILKKLDAKYTRQKLQQEFMDEFLFGSANVSTFSFLKEEQMNQLEGQVLAEIHYSQGVTTEWVDV